MPQTETSTRPTRRRLASLSLMTLLVASASTCAFAAGPDKISSLGIENEYADVISQIGGQYVEVTTILTDPNTDPHTFEASPRVAREIAGAQLIVQNGVGYDDWVNKIMSAAPRPKRQLINVQRLLGLPDNTANPHLWYDPKTMPVVAKAIADRLSVLQPSHASVFQANLKAFDASLEPWNAAIAAFKAKYDKAPIAVTEPVADYMLEAMGFDILTPYRLQAPQDVSAQNDLFGTKKVKVFAYNQQVTDTLTTSFLDAAEKAGIPVVGVYETMPTPGYNYQSWMMAEVAALGKAVADSASTKTLQNGH